MKHVAFAAALSTLALLTGCASQNLSQPSAPLNGTVQTDLKADVKVGEV